MRAPRPPIPQLYGPERYERQLPDDVTLIDGQFHMWAVSPAYRVGLTQRILAETNEDPDARPGKSERAKKWEAQLAGFAHDESLDGLSLDGDPYMKVFEVARAQAANDPKKREVIARLERIYKHREISMTTEQQYEKPLPTNDLIDLLQVFLERT